LNEATVVPHSSVKQGAPKLDIGTVDAFQQRLLKAEAIGLNDGPTEQPRFPEDMEKFGIVEQVKVKGKANPEGAAAELVAKGEAEPAIQLVAQCQFLAWKSLAGSRRYKTKLSLTAGIGSGVKDRPAAQA